MLESISLDIANYWTSNDFLTESNGRCGTFVAFDWRDDYLTEINTNIDLGEMEVENFKFDDFVDFLKNNNFNHVLGLRNIIEGPGEEWTNKLKESLKSNEMEYDEYIVDRYPTPIPEFDVPDNIFILRYSYDPYNKVDSLAATEVLFKDFMLKSDWEKYYKERHHWPSLLHRFESEEKRRVIVFVGDIENLILHESFDK